MKARPKPIPLLVGLAGLGAFAWGLYHLLLIGSCGGEYPACPPGSGKYFAGIFLGLPAAIIATIAGGGVLLFFGIFASVGATSLVAGFSDEGADEQLFFFLFGGGFLLVPLLPLLAIPFVTARARRAQRLVEAGAEAIGTVVDVQDTNVTINNNPRVRLRFRIEPQDGTPSFEADKTVTVSRVDIPRPGDRYPVWFDPADRETFAFGTNMTDKAPPGVRRLFELAGKATAPTLPAPAVPAPTASSAAEDIYTKLGKLNDLRLAGALTDEEFAREKEKLLGG